MAEQEIVDGVGEEELIDLMIEDLPHVETLLTRVGTKQRKSLIKDGEQEELLKDNSALIHILQEEVMATRHHLENQEATLMRGRLTKTTDVSIAKIVATHNKDEDQRTRVEHWNLNEVTEQEAAAGVVEVEVSHLVTVPRGIAQEVIRGVSLLPCDVDAIDLEPIPEALLVVGPEQEEVDQEVILQFFIDLQERKAPHLAVLPEENRDIFQEATHHP